MPDNNQLHIQIKAAEETIAKLRAEISQLNYEVEQVRYELDLYKNHFKESESFATYKLRVYPNSTQYDVLFVSPSFSSIVDCQDPMDHQSWFENIHPDDIAEALARQEDAPQKNQFNMKVRMFSNRLQEWRWLHFVGNGVRAEDGHPYFVNGIVMDITEQKRAENAMLAYQQRLQSLTRQLFLAEERERTRIAGLLHDGVGQDLSLAIFKLGRLASGKDADPEAIREIRDIVDQAISDTRNLVSELCPPALCQMGLGSGLRWLAHKTQREFGFRVEMNIDPDLGSLTREEESALYRMAAELLHNVGKHAGASLVVVDLSAAQRGALLTVSDDGCGFKDKPEVYPVSGKFGLFSIEERLRGIGGWIKKSPSSIGGAEVRIFVSLVE